MKYIHSQESLKIPEGVKVHIKTRQVTVEGPRGKLTKNLGHVSVSFSQPSKDVINIELHNGNRKNVATLRTVKTIINNLITGVTKGYKYKMRYVYAHFPINVNLDKNKETGLWEVEIRNFLGEKIVRRVTMHPGVDVEVSKAQKDELLFSETPSKTYHNPPPTFNKSAEFETRIFESSWMVSTSVNVVTLLKRHR
ncbi:hypothetical protein MRB53_042290 [Persea americana]|nr:hypothetical protein MRB53_042290 [Persea americana]